MNDSASNVVILDEHRPHRVMEVICLGCGFRHISCHLANSCLKDLYCPKCEMKGGIIGTGCEAILEEKGND